MKNKKKVLQFKASVNNAYFSYLFTAFWKRPVGYIVSILYLLFLAVILIIVPKAMKNQPLFIWNLTSFNIPLFSLLFLAASCAASAVTIFRISREDGTELSLSAKPLTKSAMVWIKALVYLIITFSVCLLSVGIAALVLPIFGAASDTNAIGIELSKYKALLLSVFVGNVVNLLFFSGISVFMSMVGGQVITMVTSIGIAFIMVCGNFIFGKVAKSPNDVLSSNYNREFETFRLNTKAQLKAGNANDAEPKSFVTIPCYINESGEEQRHFDTYEYWNIVSAKAKTNVYAYLDFGNQISSLYSSFGLEQSKLNDVKKLMIGYDPSYKYVIDKTTHVSTKENIDNDNYPLCIYTYDTYQGKNIPYLRFMGNYCGNVVGKEYLTSLAYNIDFDALVTLSSSRTSYSYPGKSVAEAMKNKLSFTLKDLVLNAEQQEEVKTIFYDMYLNSGYNTNFFNNNLTTSSTNIWTGNFADLKIEDKFLATSKIMVYMIIFAQEKQWQMMSDYLDEKYPAEPKHKFPFTSKQYAEVYDNVYTFRWLEDHLWYLTNYCFNVGTINETTYYARMISCTTTFLESFDNLYQFKITSLYSTPILAAIWGSIAVALFSSAIVVYKKTDFK